MTVTIVVAMGSDGVIGVDGGIPWHLPADLAHFKQITMGHPLIMGRRTYESIGRPLPGRTTIVVTRQLDWKAEGTEIALDFETALVMARAIDSSVFVVGGAQIYAEALHHGVVDEMIVTRVDATPAGDTYFPAIDWTDWTEVSSQPHAGEPGFTIVTYVRS